MSAVGYTVVRVLDELRGLPWDDVARAFMRALRPSRVDVIEPGQARPCNGVMWRVTVVMKADRSIDYIEQEVEVEWVTEALPNVHCGFDLQTELERRRATLPTPLGRNLVAVVNKMLDRAVTFAFRDLGDRHFYIELDDATRDEILSDARKAAWSLPEVTR